jgi:hypothetical protein
MKDYILERLQEPSTWRAIIWMATAWGLALSPDQKEAIIAFGMALAGAAGVLPDNLKRMPGEGSD